MRLVIIGNSAAAVGAIESIRAHNQEAQILVISEEPHLIYSRPMLSHFLGGEIDRPRLAYRAGDFYTRHGVVPILETKVSAIDPAEHTLETSDGRAYTYDRLLICTGGQPIVPPLAGLDLAGVVTFTRLDDAERLLRHLEATAARHAVVVGGGMIGIKVTDALLKRSLRVTMVELSPRILSAALDETASKIAADLLTAAGVDVRTEDTVDEIVGRHGRLAAVRLKRAGELACDALVFGIGVRPNAELARAAGIKVNRGIVVDTLMRTSADDVYAAGDVAEAFDLVVDMNRTVAIWPNAYRQGMIAGAHMVGVSRPDRGGIAMNALEVAGVPIMAIGNGNVDGEGYEVMTDLDAPNHRYRRLVLRSNRLVGAILVGQIDRAGIYTGLIRSKIDISEHRRNLLEGHLSLFSLPESYRKHVVRGAAVEV